MLTLPAHCPRDKRVSSACKATVSNGDGSAHPPCGAVKTCVTSFNFKERKRHTSRRSRIWHPIPSPFHSCSFSLTLSYCLSLSLTTTHFSRHFTCKFSACAKYYKLLHFSRVIFQTWLSSSCEAYVKAASWKLRQMVLKSHFVIVWRSLWPPPPRNYAQA